MGKDIIVADIAEKIETSLDTSDLLEMLHEIQDELDHSIYITAIRNNKQDIELHLADNNKVIESVVKLDLQEDELFWYNSSKETVGNEDDTVTLDLADREAIAQILYDNPDIADDYNIDIYEASTLIDFLESYMNELGENDLLEIYDEYFAGDLSEAEKENVDEEDRYIDDSMVVDKLNTLGHADLVDIFEGYFSSSLAYISKADEDWVVFA